ncbi:MAG: sensor histidine kinase [Ktedonobacteraceae bacterium]|nr:sensor histidine kinase [Ktedonobacteraceae bacterium]
MSYLITSVTVLCLLEILSILIVYAVATSGIKTTLENRTQTIARIASPAFLTPEASRQQFQAVWDLMQQYDPAFQGYLAVVDTHEQVVVAAGSQGSQAPATGYAIWSGLPASVRHSLQETLSTPQRSIQRTLFEQDSVYVVAPLPKQETIRGALIVKGQYMRSPTVLSALLFFGVSAVVFFFGAGVVGLAFGVVTARGLVRRLQRIVSAVNGWSRGDFSIFVSDSSSDELGQLVRRLNQMARQLQQLLRTRLDLAILEERQRLARDLHDSIKQQVFAVSLHVSTTKALLGRNEQAAQTQLNKAEELIQQAQRELTTLIRELRPVALEGKSLAEALQEYVRLWQEQTGIAVELKVEGEAEVPLALENAFFRITQEGLANVARHSQASAVKLRLTYADIVTLSISDNGRGFDAESGDHQGFGLLSMRERVQALGGHLSIQSERGKGTTITARCKPTQNDASL